MQVTTTSSSVCGGDPGEFRNAVRESRWLLSILVSVDAEPYASMTCDSPSSGSLNVMLTKGCRAREITLFSPEILPLRE